jgi:hypothetical protein
VFRHLREELGVEVARAPKKLPYVPTEAEIRAFYDAVWKARRASSATTTSSGISPSDRRDHARLGLMTRSLTAPREFPEFSRTERSWL